MKYPIFYRSDGYSVYVSERHGRCMFENKPHIYSFVAAYRVTVSRFSIETLDSNLYPYLRFKRSLKDFPKNV